MIIENTFSPRPGIHLGGTAIYLSYLVTTNFGLHGRGGQLDGGQN